MCCSTAKTPTAPGKPTLVCLRSFFGDVASSGPTVGPDGKPLHNPHVIRVDVLEVKSGIDDSEADLMCTLIRRVGVGMLAKSFTLCTGNPALSGSGLTMRHRMQTDDKYKILADVPGD